MNMSCRSVLFSWVGLGGTLVLGGCLSFQAPALEERASEEAPLGQASAPVTVVPRVSKTASNKVYVHWMPWFESKEVSGYWGSHWKMNTRNPDIMDASGRRQIASYYYPLTGPYASADPAILEYQLLLMKLSGIDGVLIDWPGTISLYDYPRNRANAEALISKVAQVGLTYAVIYEDQNVKIASDAKVITNMVAAAQADMSYLGATAWPNAAYIRVGGKPLVGVFGPQTFKTEAEWSSIFASLPTPPTFLTLWYASGYAGAQAAGEYAWPYQDSVKDHLTRLNDFYNRNMGSKLKMGGAYPGFNAFYVAGGWSSTPMFTIPTNGQGTFKTTLDLAFSKGMDLIQLITWNDYGEGTMIEPTRELGYSCLTYLQSKLGVPYSQAELELVAALYAQRKQYKGNATEQSRLDRVSDALNTLQIATAKSLLYGS